MLRHILLSACAALAVFGADAVAPRWYEADAQTAVAQRTRADFPYTVDEFFEVLRKGDSTFTRARLDSLIAARHVETLVFDGERRVFKKALRNMKLTDRAVSGFKGRGADASVARISYVDSILQWQAGTNPVGGAHRVTYRFTVDVPYNPAIAGEMLRVWMPLPMETDRQRNIKILSASHPYVESDGWSDHNTLYFCDTAPAPGDTAHFEYTAQFDVKGSYTSPERIESRIKPYKKNKSLYKKNTAFDSPHIVRMDSLARAIVGTETNPHRQSEMVFDYIAANYPWAGAREYSTIPCIPAYVISEGHGDCGQVSLLYISLMRTLGVPARWESGWMLHPGEENLHDWAEVYFEGVGWVPVDCSFGRYTNAGNDAVRTFYSHGIDSHRMATNCNIGQPFFPEKIFIRSETVDSQLGEVETLSGNLFYPAWKRSMTLLSVKPIEAKK